MYASRGGLSDEEIRLLNGYGNKNVALTEKNAGFFLNLLWAFGLSNKNEILETGEMVMYGGGERASSAEALVRAGNFASTGGWTLAVGGAMNHYSRHAFVTLSEEQQALVDKISRGIYRPCCGNSTHFPDCNHGMAMLGFLELMASQGVSEADMWKAALAVNSYWFPDTYLTIAKYMEEKGIDWERIDPQMVLGADYSSAAGYRRVASQVVQPTEQRGSGGCGVDSEPVAPQRQSGGCGI